MTAPDPLSVLDQLDEAHAKATPGEWSVDEDGDVIAPTDPYSFLVTGMGPHDAALIVAAVNALPALTAAVRAALALAYELDGESGRGSDRVRVNIADRIRSTVTAALATDGGGRL